MEKEYPIKPTRITDVLDLHGFFPEQIPEILDAFIENARDMELKELKIIHGKGKSRLKYEVHQFLKNNPFVLSFKDAPLSQGGWGAKIVIIK